MIRCLPSWPEKACVTRIDWMISLTFRLAESSVRGLVVGEQSLADELLGDRGRAARPAANGVDPGGDDAGRIDPGVVPEARVLDRGRRVDEHRRDVLELHHVAVELAEARELHGVVAVPDDRLLGQVDL